MCHYGAVIRIPIAAIPELERFITEISEGQIIFRRISAGKIWLMQGEEKPAGAVGQ